jgi:hypothetical protein
MARASGRSEPLPDTALGVRSGERQVRRAWILLIGGFLLFLALAVLTGSVARSYVAEATQERTATLEPVSGQSLLVRSAGDTDWRLVNERTTLREGDTVSTGAATTGWITLFDQGTIEVSESSLVRVNRMRTSRLLRERKEIEIEPIRGTIYVGMAPRGEFDTSLLRVRSGPATVRMRDEIRSEQTGSFLVEAQRLEPSGDETDPLLSVRVAVLRGEAEVETDLDRRILRSNQQTVVGAIGEMGEITQAVRELVRNGDFSRHFADWVEFHEPGGDGGAVSGTIERVPVDTDDGRIVAVQISRPSDQTDSWEAGIQQPIGQSLRVHSSLNLSLDLRIDEQRPFGGGAELTEFPVIVKLNYIDIQGQSRSWWHGFYIFDDPANPVPGERATMIPRGEWEHVSIDLRNLEPLPRQISSIVVYSSGHSYRALVSNLSLTSSETGNNQYD